MLDIAFDYFLANGTIQVWKTNEPQAMATAKQWTAQYAQK
jgi:hypothetical protein